VCEAYVTIDTPSGRRGGSQTRAARSFSFFWRAAPPYPKGGVYGGFDVMDKRFIRESIMCWS